MTSSNLLLEPETFFAGLHIVPIEDVATQNQIDDAFKAVLFPKRAISPYEVARVILQIMENPMMNGDVVRIDGGARVCHGQNS